MQNKTKIKILIIAVSVAILVILVNYILSEVIALNGNKIDHVYVRDVLVKAEVVKTQSRIELGLGGRSNLPKGRGMLFDMPEDDAQHFWMKGMRFPIDIIWIENGRVTGCEKNIAPSDPRTFTSPTYAGYVLEVPAGFCDENGVNLNDEVKI
ncbi:MAG TPA: DUF192 domain-containing protein [Candidatus Bathyarchaeia archaeon]|nr:DUF192 domain-containing protein [Candidatus Bathyarchaeia archaeon]